MGSTHTHMRQQPSNTLRILLPLMACTLVAASGDFFFHPHLGHLTRAASSSFTGGVEHFLDDQLALHLRAMDTLPTLRPSGCGCLHQPDYHQPDPSADIAARLEHRRQRLETLRRGHDAEDALRGNHCAEAREDPAIGHSRQHEDRHHYDGRSLALHRNEEVHVHHPETAGKTVADTTEKNEEETVEETTDEAHAAEEGDLGEVADDDDTSEDEAEEDSDESSVADPHQAAADAQDDDGLGAQGGHWPQRCLPTWSTVPPATLHHPAAAF